MKHRSGLSVDQPDVVDAAGGCKADVRFGSLAESGSARHSKCSRSIGG
jgi:hypothetical protein